MQFILGPRVPTGYEDWQQIRVGETLHLIAHPHLNVEQAANTSVSVTLIGYLLDPRNLHASNADILDSLMSSIGQGRDLFEFICPLGGRWVLLVDDAQGARLLGDAAGLRQVFYSDMQQTGELWCASQPDHIANALGLEMDPEALDFIEWFQSQSPADNWWPGDSSPYREIRRLLPNHYLELQTGTVRRFWPSKSLPTRPSGAAVAGIAETLAGMMQSAASRFELAVAMSAGWDSRLMLAACRPLARDLSYYTGKRPEMAWTHMDVHVPTRLLAKLGLPHDIIELGNEVTPEFAEAFTNNVPFAHTYRLASQQSQLNYYGRRKVGVTGNVSEVVRCYYHPAEPTKEVTAEYLMTVTGMEHPFARTHFSAWLDGVGDTHGYHILDLFYWEQRAGSWFAHNCLEFDLAWRDIFIPFNSRQLLVDMLAVDESLRKGPDYELYRQLMVKLWPEVLSEPINPTANRRGPRKYLRAVARRLKRLLVRV
jgi:hypothetical protein